MSLSAENEQVARELDFLLSAEPFLEWSDLIEELMNAARSEGRAEAVRVPEGVGEGDQGRLRPETRPLAPGSAADV